MFIHTWSVIKRKNPNANPNLTHTYARARLQPQKTKFTTNSALVLMLLTAKSETNAHGEINTVKQTLIETCGTEATHIKFVGTMGRDFKKKGRSRKKTGRLVTLY
jgi:hypothetical protein